jgi:FdhD protein
MSKDAELYPVIKAKGTVTEFALECVAEESPLTVFLNGEEIGTVLCSPTQPEELTLGFLFMEGFIRSAQDILSIDHDPSLQAIYVRSSSDTDVLNRMNKRLFSACCGKSRSSFTFSNDDDLAKVQTSNTVVSLQEIYDYEEYLENHLPLFKSTGGVHSGGIGYQGQVLFTSYDIGRHNVFDKLAGSALKANHDLQDHILFFSGRISSEILLKVSKMNIPILVGRSAPTDLALNLARRLCITVIGFARGDRLNVYTCPERIKLENLEVPTNLGEN